MSQLTYAVYHLAQFLGAHGQVQRAIPGRNNSGAEIAYGRACVHDAGAGTSDLAFKLPSAATEPIKGVLMYDHGHEPETTGLGDDKIGTLLQQGDMCMLTEQAVLPTDPVYVRFEATGASGTTPAVGQVRKDNDGVAEITTVTPTAVNLANYVLTFNINGQVFTFNVTGDASATATEINDAFRVAMAANAAFTALVTASGTTTLILTGTAAAKGLALNAASAGAGVMAIVIGTAASVKAILCPNAKFTEAQATAGGLVNVNWNIP